MAKQLEFKKVNGWGGRRRGAGRTNRTGQVSHAKRERIDFKKPLHITLRLRKGMANLRTARSHKQFTHAIDEARRFGLHVVHYSLLSNHIHLIAEADNNKCLGRGMKSFGSRFGKAVRKVTGRSGSVFAGRFHVHILKTPTEMKRALEYVLLNSAKHQKFIEYIDSFSSGFAFREWKQLIGRRLSGFIEDQVKMFAEASLKPSAVLVMPRRLEAGLD